MPTNDERRSIAVVLRAYDGRGANADTIGEIMAVIIGAGDVDGWSWQEVFARLADLIDPGESGQDRDGVQMESDDVLIFPARARDALLELAVDLDARATELLKVNDLDQSRQRRSARQAHAMDLMAACSRIREACGVVE